MRYAVEFKPSAAREFSKLSRSIQVKIKPRIDALADDPRPHGVEKVSGEEDIFRIRIGDYRVVYRIQDDHLFVLVIRIGHRKDVYRGL